jgi:hypothetical protein
MTKKKGGNVPDNMVPVSSLRPMAIPPTPMPTVAAPTAPTPAQPMVQQAPVGGHFDVLSTVIATLNTNPYLIGILMLLLNLGGRFLSLELTKKQEAFLQQPWLRPLLFFTVIFVATRNLAVAFWITLFFFLVVWVLANEKSPYCLISSWKEEHQKNTSYDKNMTIIEQLTRLI